MNTTQIQKLSKYVFDLESIDQIILKFFAVNGPGNQNEITRFVTNSNEHKKCNRWSIRRNILGSKRTSGLIPREYLFKKAARKYRWKKQENTYYPTVKGILALLFSDFKFDKTYPLTIFFDFISLQSNNRQIRSIAKKYIESQIKFFLAWHAIKGLQLRDLTASYAYYRIFVNEDWKETVSVLPFAISDKKKLKDIENITSEYLLAKDRLIKLGNEKQIPDIPVFCYYPANDSEDFPNEPDSKHNISLVKFILNWYAYIETFQVTWYNKKFDHLEMVYYDEIPYSDSYKEFIDNVEKAIKVA